VSKAWRSSGLKDPRKRRGQRYDLPFLLTCLVAALLCNCNSLEAVGQWCALQRPLLARHFGPRPHLTPTGALYRRLLPRLSPAHVEAAIAAWVRATRPMRDRSPWPSMARPCVEPVPQRNPPPTCSRSPRTRRTKLSAGARGRPHQ
jgi:hypothetical protein